MRTSLSAAKKAGLFLEVSSSFHLGELPTEKPNSGSRGLSEISCSDPKKAISIIKSIDLKALGMVVKGAGLLTKLCREINRTVHDGGRVFLCGCGSTGRLSISLEVFWRQIFQGQIEENSIVSFMAGGDGALVRAVENFEDHPEFAGRQLDDLGFQEGDLLISSSEGGETPFVIGALLAAQKRSRRNHYFLYCNPDEVLMTHVGRSKEILENPLIEKMSICVGPQALSGSTRMQASTALMLVIGLALLSFRGGENFSSLLNRFRELIRSLDFNFLEPFIVAEAEIYRSGGYIIYETNEYGITLLTDTTERAPTFSLVPFENSKDKKISPSLSYMCLPEKRGAMEAWRKILMRDPRALDWRRYAHTSSDYLYGFDFSKGAMAFRKKTVKGVNLHHFRVWKDDSFMRFDFEGIHHAIDIQGISILFENLLLKILLNIHSTVVMGRMGRYKSNMMTWVRPANNKLIDRSIRYVQELLREEGLCRFSYEDIAYVLFEEMERPGENEAIVIRVFERLVESSG